MPYSSRSLTLSAAQQPRRATLAPNQDHLHRYRAGFAYVDAELDDGENLKLCRLRYGGSAHQWGFAIYRASHDDYEDSYLPTGYPVGTAEEALDTACGLYLNDPTAWLGLPTTNEREHASG